MFVPAGLGTHDRGDISSSSCSTCSRASFLPRKVTILEDPDQHIHLKNLSLHQATTEEEALNLLFLGDTNRMIAEVIASLLK